MSIRVEQIDQESLYGELINYLEKKIPRGITPPLSPIDEDLWIDTTTEPYLLKQYRVSTTSWVTVAGSGGGSIDDIPLASTTVNGLMSSTDKSKLDAIQKGVANGYAGLDGSGKIPSSQLPSYVDDVEEYANFFVFPETGESGKIYVDTSTNQSYRWSGSIYVEISQSLALGETSSTAYRGDRGKTAYDHSQIVTGNPHGTTKANVGLGNVDNTSDANKPISTATQTALNAKVGIVIQAAAPTGDAKILWINSTTKVMSYWDGSAWQGIVGTWGT